MRLFFLNIVLAFIWVMLLGEVTIINFLFGLLLSYGIFWMLFSRRGFGSTFVKLPKFIKLFFFFIWELFKANFKVAYDIITIKHYMTPGILGVELEAESDLEITLLANLVTLTPGTLSMDVSDDRKTLYIHFMYIDDEDSARESVKVLERKILEITR